MFLQIKRFGIILITAIGLAHCGPTIEQENQDALTSWQGRPVDQLIFKWGAPDSSYEMKDGRRALTWSHENIETRTSTDSYGRSYVSETWTETCTITWITDGEHRFLEVARMDGEAEVCDEIITPP